MKESNFQLVGKPIINKISYETNKGFDFKGDFSLDVNNDINIIKGTDESAHEAMVVLNIGIFTNKDFNEVPFNISIEIEGYFKWDEELQKNQALLDIMLKQNAPAILYSYIRPIITLMTVEANMPPLVIPLMNFQD